MSLVKKCFEEFGVLERDPETGDEFYKLRYKKKFIELVKVEGTSLLAFRFIGGGELPEGIRGHYTSQDIAISALYPFLAQQAQAEKKETLKEKTKAAAPVKEAEAETEETVEE